MKTAPTLAALLAATSLPALLAQDLVPVAPPAAPDPVTAPAPNDLELEAWHARLTAADFAQRAAALDEAAALARHHAGFRGQLEAWAAGDDGLAWTAFLALREADRPLQLTPTWPGSGWAPPHGIPEDAYIPFTHPPGTTFGPNGPSWPQDHGWPFGGDGLPGGIQIDGWPFGPDGLDLDGQFWAALPQLDVQGQGHSVLIGPDGVTVRVEETTADGTEVREYHAESMEALEAEHPELFAEGGPLAGMQLQVTEPGELLLPAPARPLPNLPGLRPMPAPAPAPEVGGPVTRTDVLGIMVANRPEGGGAPASGLLVDSVVAGTIAAHVGLEPGDLVIEVAGARVRSAEDISAALAEVADGAAVKVRWVDDGGILETGTWTPPAPPASDG